MLINLGEQLNKYNIEPKGIIHCGIHWGEEHDEYVSYGIKNMVYIEPCNDAFERLLFNIREKVGDPKSGSIGEDSKWGHVVFKGNFGNIICYKVACGVEEKKMVMYVSHDNQGQSNSLLEPHLHLEQHSEVVFNDVEEVYVVPLDELYKRLHLENEPPNILAMDCQGFEGEVLKGATETLKHIDCIYTEVNRDSTYRGNMLIEEMDEYLKDFTRVETYWPSPNWSWGDSVFISNKLL